MMSPLSQIWAVSLPWLGCKRHAASRNTSGNPQRCLQGPETANKSSHSQLHRNPAASYEAMRAQLLTVAAWALAGSGWAYILLPRLTLDALFGESGACHGPSFLSEPRATTGHSATWLGICDAACDAPCLRQQVPG